MAAHQQHQQTGPKTAFGKWMVYKFIPQYSNNVQGLVYIGAAILIIIVGIRGLGTLARDLAVIPNAMLDHGGKLDANWVMAALFLEFSLLLVLAIVTMFTPEDIHYNTDQKENSHEAAASSVNLPNVEELKAQIAALKSVADNELKSIDEFVEKFNALNKKITKIQMESLNALSEMKSTITK